MKKDVKIEAKDAAAKAAAASAQAVKESKENEVIKNLKIEVKLVTLCMILHCHQKSTQPSHS